MRERTGWDTFFIILTVVLSVLLIASIIIPLSHGLNTFKLIAGNQSGYNFVEKAQDRDTNILKGLLGVTDPEVYVMSLNEKDRFEYLDEKGEKPFFKEFNDYDILIEAYNEPEWSNTGLEIYGPYGIEFSCQPITLDGAQGELLSAAQGAYPTAMLIPYYTVSYHGVTYISAVDLSASTIALEYFDGEEYTAVATISGDTWKAISEKNSGVAVLRNPDGTLIFGGGSYRLTLLLKQVLIDNANGEAALRIRQPRSIVYDLRVNHHECANGVLIANNAVENMDIQLNLLNRDGAVCYAPESKISMGDSFGIGVSFSEKRHRKHLGSLLSQMGLKAFIDVYKYDHASDAYVLVESKKIMDPYTLFLNKTFVFDGADYQTGKYKLILRYSNRFEHIEQEYEYYLVFEN